MLKRFWYWVQCLGHGPISLRRRGQYWIGSWIELFQALVKIVTFNFVVPHWDMDYLYYLTIKWFEEDKAIALFKVKEKE